MLQWRGGGGNFVGRAITVADIQIWASGLGVAAKKNYVPLPQKGCPCVRIWLRQVSFIVEGGYAPDNRRSRISKLARVPWEKT